MHTIPLTTESTGERVAACMNAFMGLQCLLADERLATDSTHVGPLTRVQALVTTEVGAGGEPTITNIAHVGPVTGMTALVLLEVGHFQERLATNTTDQRPGPGGDVLVGTGRKGLREGASRKIDRGGTGKRSVLEEVRLQGKVRDTRRVGLGV